MIIETARDLRAWCIEQAAPAVQGLDAAAADHAMQCVQSVVWRHAIGQGLRLVQRDEDPVLAVLGVHVGCETRQRGSGGDVRTGGTTHRATVRSRPPGNVTSTPTATSIDHLEPRRST